MLYAAGIAVVAGLLAFGAVMYRSGRKAAENSRLNGEKRADEKVDEIIRGNAGLTRNELLTRLRNSKDQ